MFFYLFSFNFYLWIKYFYNFTGVQASEGIIIYCDSAVLYVNISSFYILN